MVDDKEDVTHRYYGFMVQNNLTSGSVSQAQVDELWRYLSAESREFSATSKKDEDDAKKAQAAQAAAAFAAKNNGGKGDPNKNKGDPKGGGAGSGKPPGGKPPGGGGGMGAGAPGTTKGAGRGVKGGGKNDAPKGKTACRFFDSDVGCRFGANCTNWHRNLKASEGKCFNCGSKQHTSAQCTAPRPKAKAAEAQPNQQQQQQH